MIIVEKIEWLSCNRCHASYKMGHPATTGWLKVDTMAMGIVADTRVTMHLCISCKTPFEEFWGP